DPPASHLGTRPLPLCRVRASRGFPPHARRSFFERVYGFGILLVSLGPGAHMREAQVLEGAMIVSSDTESPNSSCTPITRSPAPPWHPQKQTPRPPAHHPMDRSDRALLYDSAEKGPMGGVELGRHPRRRNIDETVRSLLVEPDHPVPQRLTIHAANLRRLFPRGPLEHGRNR